MPNKKIVDLYTERINYWYNVFDEKIPVPNLKIRNMKFIIKILKI